MQPPALPPVLLLAAVESELKPLERRLRGHVLPCAPHFVLTGVGKAASACRAAEALRELSPRLALQVGCAGACPASGLAIGDVVVATHEVFGDEGVVTADGFLDLEQLKLPVAEVAGSLLFNRIPTASPAPAAWGELLRRAGGRYRLVSGPLVTVSTGAGTRARAEWIESRWHGLAENMEGAAAALAAWRRQCPFFEVRGISNRTGDERLRGWNLEAACEHAAEVAAALLELVLRAGKEAGPQGPSESNVRQAK